MYILRKIATECKNCDKRDICDHKRFVACAVADLPTNNDELTSAVRLTFELPALIKRVNVTPNIQITIDMEDIRKELCKSLSYCFVKGK